MSEADGQGITVTADGVAVEKAYEFERFPVPAVTLVVRSMRDETVSVRVSDPLPDAVSMEDVGLHSEYGEEHAEVVDGAVRLEFDLDPEEAFTVVYGLRHVTQNDLPDGPTDPGLAAAATDRATDSQSTEIVREVISGVDDTDDEVEPIDLADPTDGEEADEAADVDTATEADTDASESADDEPTSAESVADDADEPDDGIAGETDGSGADSSTAPPAEARAGESLAADLALEVREGAAAEEDVALLREALDVDAGGSTEARIRDLQSELADLRAYTDALESFLDENGTARELLTDLRGDLDSLAEEVGSAADRLADHDEALSSLDADVETARTAVEDLRDDLDDVRGTVETVEGSLETVEETVLDIEDDLDATRKRLADVEERVDDGFDRLDDRVDEVAADVDSLGADLSAVQEEPPDDELADRLAELEERVETLAEDMDEVAGVQERLQSVFGDETGDGDLDDE